MGLVLIIVLGALSVFLFVFLFSAWLTKQRIIGEFRRGNVIVDGKKGNGKDLLFQEVIRTRREDYFANIDYGYKFKGEQWPKDLSVAPNTYADFISNDVKTVEKDVSREGVDTYLSDGGIILPSQQDAALHKAFPSFPIYYALSRHLYNSNIHINTQNVERVWKALREQADYFVRCRGVIKWFPFLLIIRVTEYDQYKAVVADKRAYRGGGFLNRFNDATRATFAAENGFIKDGFVIVRKRTIKYDSRAYHIKLFGYPAPKKKGR